MRNLSQQEKEILSELIRNPRASDNEVSRKTKISVATINRKRKALEKEGILYYFTYVNNWKNGTEGFGSRQLYIIKLKYGITRKQVMDTFFSEDKVKTLMLKHILHSFLGEVNGQVAFIYMIESRIDTDILEIFNAEIGPELIQAFGKDAIQDTVSIPITQTFSVLHNYNTVNMENGKMKKYWPNSKIFVS